MLQRTRRVRIERDAERPGLRYHAERGNDHHAEHPVLFINPHKDLGDLAACAAHRFIVIRDLTRVTQAVHLLMREGCAILDVIQARAVQREEGSRLPFSGV